MTRKNDRDMTTIWEVLALLVLLLFLTPIGWMVLAILAMLALR